MADKFSKYAVKKEDKFSKYRATPQQIEEYHNNLDQPQEETKGFGGIASDAMSKGLQAAFNFLPSAAALPGEAYGAGKQLLTNYPRYAANAIGGFGQLGHSLLSSLGNTRDYLAKKELIPQSTPSFRLPESVLPKEYNYAEALGATGHEPGDELIRSGAKQLFTAAPANKLFELASEIPLTKGVGAKKLEAVKAGLRERGATKLNISNDILKDAKQYLPKDEPTKKLLSKAKSGDYDALFTLQSDLRKRGSALQRSFSGAERNHGFDAQNLRQRLLNGMKDSIRTQGHGDLADLMHLGQKRYAQHMKYRKPVTGAAALALGYPKAKKIIKLLTD